MSLYNNCNRELKYYLANNKATLKKSASTTAHTMKPNVLSYQLNVVPNYVGFRRLIIL